MTLRANRINRIAQLTNSKNYLEIGVNRGETFLEVEMSHKTAVDPNFSFDYLSYKDSNSFFFQVTSDKFFEQMQELLKQPPYITEDGEKFCFDIIYIDGLHTFEQSYRDFINSLPYSHKNTVWVIDDTVPVDPYSAYPDQTISYQYRTAAGLYAKPWHGDVFKTVLAIHDFHPEFSFCTAVDAGNPQTIVWRGLPQEREKQFGTIEEIKKLSYFDLLDNAHMLVPVANALAYEMIGLTLNPQELKSSNSFKQIMRPVITIQARQLHVKAQQCAKQLEALQNNLKADIENVTKKLSIKCAQAEAKNSKLQTKNLRLEKEKEELQEHIMRYEASLSWRITKWLRYF